jgi:uncharacterized membrane protein
MRSLRPIFIISGIITLVSFGAAFYFMFFGPEKLEFSGKSLRELADGGQLLGIATVLVVVAVVFFTTIFVMKTILPARIRNGVTAPAKVLSVSDTGVSVNDNPQVKLLLEVKPRDRAAFQAETRMLVSRLNVSLVQPGVSAEVVYDPVNPTRIQVTNLDLKPVELNDAESRLRELERLYDERLITSEEYRTKREEIIKGL